MNKKYFTVEVKPPIDADLLDHSALASDDDVIFSWTPFEVPRGASRLLNVTARVAGTDGTAQHHPFQLLFAKSKIDATTGVMSNPASIGEYNTVATAIKSLNQIIGGIKIEAIDYMCQSLVGCSVASTGNSVAANGANIDMVLMPSGGARTKYLNGSTLTDIPAGQDILWVAGIACGAFDFRTTVESDNGEVISATATTIHTDVKNANLVFSVGDVIQEVDNTIIGTITAIGAADSVDVDLTVDRGNAGRETAGRQTLADNVKIYHRNPITLELSFEK